jgi:hypothetical protein
MIKMISLIQSLAQQLLKQLRKAMLHILQILDSFLNLPSQRFPLMAAGLSLRGFPPGAGPLRRGLLGGDPGVPFFGGFVVENQLQFGVDLPDLLANGLEFLQG